MEIDYKNNNIFNELTDKANESIAGFNNETDDTLLNPSTNASSNKFNIKLNDAEQKAQADGFLNARSGVIKTNLDEYSTEDISSILGGSKGAIYSAEDSEAYIPDDDIAGDSVEELYRDSLGTTKYTDLRRACGLSERESFTDYYNRTGFIPQGFETTAKLLLAEEKVKKIHAEYKSGKIGYADFLYQAYGKDILKAQGHDFSSSLYWYNQAKKGVYTNPLSSSTFLSDVISLAEQKFQAETWYESISLDKIKNNAAVWATGGEVTAEDIKTLFADQFETISKYFESEEKFIKLYKGGFIDINTFNPFIDIDHDDIYDYYYSTDGKLYAAEGSSGTGTNTCKIYYEKDNNGDKVVDRVTTHGWAGNGWFQEVADSFLGSFFSVFTGLVDFGAQVVGLIGHWCGNDDVMLDWNAFKNNNILFGGVNTKDLQGFQWDEGDDWARGILNATGTIVGMIASAGLTGAINTVATTAANATAGMASGAAKGLATAGTAVLKGVAFASRTYSGLRGGNVTTVVPKLAEHAMANRLVTAAALAMRDGVSTMTKLSIQNQMLSDDEKLSEGEIIGRGLANIGINTITSFALRAVGDSGVTSFFRRRGAYEKAIQKRINALSDKVSNEALNDFINKIGAESLKSIGKSVYTKSIDTVADIIENIVTQTTTAYLSSKDGNFWESMKNITLNPQFILTNLYIAKQDMGFKFFGRTDSGKLIGPHLDDDEYIRAAITSVDNLSKTYDTAINTIRGRYASLVEKNPESAQKIMDNIIKPAMALRVGEQGESEISATIKALTFLCEASADIPTDVLGIDEKTLSRLTKDEKSDGGIRAIVLADIKKSAVEKIIERNSYDLMMYQKMYNNLYDANISVLKGEFSIRQAYERAKNEFEANAKGFQGTNTTVTTYTIDKDFIMSNQRIKSALEGAGIKLDGTNKTLTLTKEQYDSINNNLKSLGEDFNDSSYQKHIHIKTVSDKKGDKISLHQQLNEVLGLAGLKTSLDESILKEMNFYSEARPDDYNKINSSEFSDSFDKYVIVDHIANDSTGKLPSEYELLVANIDFQKAAGKILGVEPNESAARTLLNDSNIFRMNGEYHNNYLQDILNPNFDNAMKALAIAGLFNEVKYLDKEGKIQTIYVQVGCFENTIFGQLKQADAISTALKALFCLNMAKDTDIIKSGCDMLIDIFIRNNLQICQGKTAKSYLKDFETIKANIENGVAVFDNSENTHFLDSAEYQKGARKLIATYLCTLASSKIDAISRVQLINIFDKLGISYDEIDVSGNDEAVSTTKKYLECYKTTGEIKELAGKLQAAKQAGDSNDVSSTDLKNLDSAIKKVLESKEIQQLLIKDKLVGNDFFNELEGLVAFTEGQLEVVKENPLQTSLGQALKSLDLDNYLTNEKEVADFVDSFLALRSDDIDSSLIRNDLIDALITYGKLLQGTKRYDKKDLIIVNLSQLETKEFHNLVRELEVESSKEALSVGSKNIIASLEKKLGYAKNIDSLRALCRLQTDNETGVLTFDRNNETELNDFKNMMYSIGYSEVEVNSMLESGRSLDKPGISFTSDSSRGLEFNLTLENYNKLMQLSKIITDDNSLVFLNNKEKLDVKLAVKDRYGVLVSDADIDSLNLEAINKLFNITLTKDAISLDTAKEIITCMLKLGKAASKIDNETSRKYFNSYSYKQLFADMNDNGAFGNAITLLYLIKAANAYVKTESDTSLYSVTMSDNEYKNFIKKTASLYEYINEDLPGKMHKVVITNVNQTNWNLSYIIKNFTDKNGNINLRSMFVLPNELEIAQLPEQTYNFDTIKVEGLSAGGANFLDFLKGQNFDRFDNVEDFKSFISNTSLNIKGYSSEDDITKNLEGIIKSYLKSENQKTVNTLTSRGFTKEEIDIIFDKDQLNKIAEAVEKNMGEYKNFGIDYDGKPIVEKLDYSKIALESGYKASTVKKIVELLKTLTPATYNSRDDIFILQKDNPYADIASMIRYDSSTGKAFISIDDIRVITKEQFNKLEELGLVTPQLKEKLALIDKYNLSSTPVTRTNSSTSKVIIGQKLPNSDDRNVVFWGDRAFTVVDINGESMPFYLSSGLNPKEGVTPGKWYPCFGIYTKGFGQWINKGSSKEIASYYRIPAFKEAGEYLDKTIGDIRQEAKDYSGPHIMTDDDETIINQGFIARSAYSLPEEQKASMEAIFNKLSKYVDTTSSGKVGHHWLNKPEDILSQQTVVQKEGFKDITDENLPYSAQRVTYSRGTETTQINAAGQAFIKNDAMESFANEILFRSERLKYKKEQETFFKKLSAATLNGETSKLLSEMLNIYTTPTVDHPGSVYVANMENKLALGEMLTSIASLAQAIPNTVLKDASIVDIDSKTAIELALKIYFNTTGTDMSSSYNRYTIVYQDENNEWHIDNVGDNIYGRKEAISLGRQLFLKGILDEKLNYKKAFLFNASKNIMSLNASSYGENIKVMSLDKKSGNVSYLRNMIYRNCIADYFERNNELDFDVISDSAADIVAKQLGSYMTRSEIRTLYMQNSKTLIMDEVSKTFANMPDATKEAMVESLNSAVDRLLHSTLETVENLHSAADFLSLKDQALSYIDLKKGKLTDNEYDILQKKANKMVADTIDAFTYFINESSVPSSILDFKNSITDVLKESLDNLSDDINITKVIDNLDSEDGELHALDLKRVVSNISDQEERKQAVANIIQYKILSGNRGKDLQFFLLGNEDYLNKLQENYARTSLQEGMIDIHNNDGSIAKTINIANLIDGKAIVNFDLENYFGDNLEDKIYEISFAVAKGSKDLIATKDEDILRYRILIKYDDSEISGYNTLASTDKDAATAYRNYEDSLKYNTRTKAKHNGEYIFTINSSDANTEVLKAVDEAINHALSQLGLKEFILLGHNSRATDIKKIEKQFGSLGKLADAVEHIDTQEDIAKIITPNADINKASVSLANLRRQLGDESTSHLAMDDAIFSYKYFLYEMNNLVDVEKIKASLYKDIDKLLESLDANDIDKSELFKLLTSVKQEDGTLKSFDDLWKLDDLDDSAKDYRELYSKYGTSMTDKLLNELVTQRNTVLNSDEIQYLYKKDYNLEHELIYEYQSEFLNWLLHVNDDGSSNLNAVRDKVLMFINNDGTELTEEKFQEGVTLMNDLVASLRKEKKQLKENNNFTSEVFLKMPINEIEYLLNTRFKDRKPTNTYDEKSFLDFIDDSVSKESFEQEKRRLEKDYQSFVVSKVYDKIFKAAELNNIDSDTKNLLFDLMTGLKTGDFENAYKPGTNKFIIEYKGPKILKNFYFDSLDDAMSTFSESVDIPTNWVMASGTIPGRDITLEDGTKYKLKSTDIGITRHRFEQLFGGASIESYKESLGLQPTDDIYISLYRVPGVGQNIVHTYRVRIVDNSYNDIILSPDIFMAYHSGDFDSDKIMLIKPDASLQKYGNSLMTSTDKTWDAADELINMLYDSTYDPVNDFNTIEEIKKATGVSISDLLTKLRNGEAITSQNEIDALNEYKDKEYIKVITKEEASKYPTLKSSDFKDGDLYYSEYVIGERQSDEIIRRLALDTKFLIDEILSYKDSATGFASKKFKALLDGRYVETKDATELFTYNQFNLSKDTRARLKTALELSKDVVITKTISSIKNSFGDDIASSIKDFLDIAFKSVQNTDEGVRVIIDAYRGAELLYRGSDDFKKFFNENLIPNILDDVDKSGEAKKLKQLAEYARYNNPTLNIDKKLDDPSNIDNMSLSEILEHKYKLATDLDETLSSRRFTATSGDTALSRKMITKLRAQLSGTTDVSKIQYIDGHNSDNFFDAEILIAGGLVQNIASDTFEQVSNRHVACSSRSSSCEFKNLTKDDLINLQTALRSPYHDKLKIGDFEIGKGVQIIGAFTKQGAALNNIFDKDGNLLVNPEDIKTLHLMETHSLLGNKIGMLDSGAEKGTIYQNVTKDFHNNYDLIDIIKKLDELYKQYDPEIQAIISSKDVLKSLSKEQLQEIRRLNNKRHEAKAKQAKLTAEYAAARAEFDKRQRAKNKPTWDELALEYNYADDTRRSEIRILHANISKNYQPDIFDTVLEIMNIEDEISLILGGSLYSSNSVKSFFNERKAVLELLESSREKLPQEFSELHKDKDFTERYMLLEKMQLLGVDTSLYNDNLTKEQVKKMSQFFNSVDFLSASNMFDLKKLSAGTGDTYQILYYDENFNEIKDPTQAKFTKLKCRAYCPEANSFYKQDTKSKPIDVISFVNDRTNPDTLIKLHGKWYNKVKQADGSYKFYYDSRNENEISRLLDKANTPWASSTNGVRVYRTLLAKLLYEHCAKIKEELPNVNALVKNMLDGTLTSGNTGSNILYYIFDKMSDDEVKQLYTSKDPYVRYIIDKLPDMSPSLKPTDAEELDGIKKLESKTKAKEIHKNNTLLYYYTRPESFLLGDQNILSGGKKVDGYNYTDASEAYYPLEKFVTELAETLGVDKKYLYQFKNSINDYTLNGVLNLMNGKSGNQSNSFNTQSYIDCVPYMKKTSRIAGIADPKVGDVAATQDRITPEQRLVNQYPNLTRDLKYMFTENAGNDLYNDSSKQEFIRGDSDGNYFSTRYNDPKEVGTGKAYWSDKLNTNLKAYLSTAKNRLERVRRLTTNRDQIISDIAPRYFGLDANKGLVFTANPKPFIGTYGEYADVSKSGLYGYKRHEMFEPVIDQLRKSISDSDTLREFYNQGTDVEAQDKLADDNIEKLTNLVKSINKPEVENISTLVDMDDLNYLLGNIVDETRGASSTFDKTNFDLEIERLKASKDIAEFHTDILSSSKIKEADADRTVVAYKANVKSYRNQLLGNEFLTVVEKINANADLKESYNRYVKLKNLMSSLAFCNSKLETKLKDKTAEYYQKVKTNILKELNVTSEGDLSIVSKHIESYRKIFAPIDEQLNIVCNRIYDAMQAYCNATGQTCPNRARFFLPTKATGGSKEERAKNSSLIFAGTAKYINNPFSIKGATSGLDPEGCYTEFDALTNIVSAASQVGSFHALLNYREEMKNNGAMSNALAFNETCSTISSKISVDELNNYGSSDTDSLEIAGLNNFIVQVKDTLNISNIKLDPEALTSCAKYASLYNIIYTRFLAPLKATYGDITFHNLLSQSMANPQDATLDSAIKAYTVMMDIVGKITTIQIERGEKTTLTDGIYDSITKYAEEHGLVITDQFGREYNKDLSQFKALSPYATDDYIFRLTHGECGIEGTYEQNVALDALRGDLYFMDATVAKHTQKLFYTREPSLLKKITKTIGNLAIKFVMANPVKFPTRMLNFSMFDLSSSIASGNFETVKFLPQVTKEIGAYLQSNGKYCAESLREFMDITGVDPLSNQVSVGERYTQSKNPYLNFVGKQFTAQHLANRYAMYLSLKQTLDNNGGKVESIYSRLGNSYYLKDKLQKIADNMKNDISGTNVKSNSSSRIAAMIVSNTYGTYGDMPGIAGDLSAHGFIFTTFPLALVRFARNEIRSGAFAAKEIFTGTADSSTLKWLGRQVGSISTLVIAQVLLQMLPVWLMEDDEEDKKEMIDSILSDDASIELFSSILLDDTVMNTSTVWNPYYGVKNLVANPLINAIKNHKDDDDSSKAMNIFGDTIGNYFNQNIWNKLNPAFTMIPDALLPKNSFTNPYGNQGENFFDNLARKALGYSMGTKGANAFMNTMQTDKYNEDNFVTTLGRGFENALIEELGNSKSFKSDWKNYNNALNIIYEYKSLSNKDTYNTNMNSEFNKEYYDGLKSKLRNAMHIKASPTTIYNIIREAINNNVSKKEIKSAITAVSIRAQLQRLSNQADFYASLSQKEYNSIKSALAYEDRIFPNLDELYDEVSELNAKQIAKTKSIEGSFKKTNNSLNEFFYNYPTLYSSNTYKPTYKNHYYNNVNNWNTNTYSKNKYYNRNTTPLDTYNSMRNITDYGTSKDIWGTETQHYKDGTSYVKRDRGFSPFDLGGNK